MSKLNRLFKPRALAVIGASNNLSKPGGRLLMYCLEHAFPGKLYPVNPGTSEIMGLKAYARVVDIPEQIDVACIAVPSSRMQEVVEDCVQKRVKFIVIYAAGFSEIHHTQEQAKLVETATRGGCRILGPNCQGVVSAVHNTIGSYHACLNLSPRRGEIALVSQTGALGGFLCTSLWERGIGISHFVSVGNESDLEVSDFIEYLADDDETRVIGLFLEGVRDGPRFRRAAERAFKARKPIVVLKTGKSESGRVAALTHTGAIAGSDRVYDGLFRQLRMIRAATMEDMLDALIAFALQPLPTGSRAAFVSPSGAACSLLSDVADEVAIEMAELSRSSLDKIREVIPAMAVAKNPLDIVYVYGNPNARTLIGDIIDIMARDENVDIVVPGLTVGGPAATEIIGYSLKMSRRVREKVGVPILYWWAVDRESFRAQEQAFAVSKIPLYTGPERAVRAAAAMTKYARWVSIEAEARGNHGLSADTV